MAATAPVYQPREPTDSTLWKIVHHHYEDFRAGYDEHCEKPYGFFRIPIILRIDCKDDQELQTTLCHCARDSLEIFFRTVLGRDDGILGTILVIFKVLALLKRERCFKARG
ncbi:MAG: hypothetical protein ACUVWY_09450 [Desulfosoma sp.]|uniref:hypothetical protein n=1 Tax=Desulfosoma sp. TaxID=2603217 RepID=UPI00404A75F0